MNCSVFIVNKESQVNFDEENTINCSNDYIANIFIYFGL